MKVELVRVAHRPSEKRFNELEPGTGIIHKGDLCVIIDPDDNEDGTNAIVLSDDPPSLYTFEPDDIVTPVQVTITY